MKYAIKFWFTIIVCLAIIAGGIAWANATEPYTVTIAFAKIYSSFLLSAIVFIIVIFFTNAKPSAYDAAG